MSHHYLYIAKVKHDVEPTSYESAARNVHWEKAMDEEMTVLDVNHTWDLVPVAKRLLAVNGCTR